MFDKFTADGHPTHGTVPGEGGPQSVSIAYRGDGSSVWTYSDGRGQGTTLTRDADGHVTTMVSDGWTFNSFDGHDRPTAGDKDGEKVTITYDADDGSVWTYTDTDGSRTVITRGSDGQPVKMVADGWTFTAFDDQGRPLSGSKPGDHGGAPQKVTVKYGAAGSSVWTYNDGTVVTKNGDGGVTSLQADGWTYTTFDDHGRPTYGKNGGKSVHISYQGSWTVSKYNDGTTVGTDAQGHPLYQINKDKSAFEFRVEIPKLLEAKKVVAAQAGFIASQVQTLRYLMGQIAGDWDSPAGRQYAALNDRLSGISTQVQGLLEDSITAMQKSYDQYVAAEGGNLANLTPVHFNPDGTVTPR